MDKLNKITLIDDENKDVDFYVLEHTMLCGTNYILVADSDDVEEIEEYLILKETGESDDDMLYEVVTDELELSSISKVFSEIVDDFDLEV